MAKQEMIHNENTETRQSNRKHKSNRERACECWLASIRKISPEKKILLTKEMTAEAFYDLPILEKRRICEYYQIDPQALEQPDAMIDSESRQKELQEKGLRIATIWDDDYPRKLKQIPNPPYALYYQGTLPGNSFCAAIVGARQCSEYGRMTAAAISKALAECGVSVISGMAFGIDSAGHEGALKGGGRTYAVMGCGVDICYPARGRQLRQQILERGGVLSEYPPETPPIPRYFPERNRIISGLSDIVIVVEAKMRSGSLITADFAMEQGRDVYAVPGRICDPWSQGTNYLIYQGCGILYDIPEFLKEMNFVSDRKDTVLSVSDIVLDKEEQLVYEKLDYEPKMLEVIMEQTGLSVRDTLNCIGRLKKRGLVKECYKNYFCRIFR